MEIMSEYGCSWPTHAMVCVCRLNLGHILGLIHASAKEKSRVARDYPSLFNTGTQRADE